MELEKYQGSYLYSQMKQMVEDKLGFPFRGCGKHFYPDSGDFDDWIKHKGYPEFDSEGKPADSSQIWFKEYMDDSRNGKWLDTPYLDFWHFQLGYMFEGEVRNDSHQRLFVGYADQNVEETWIWDIQKVWKDLFGHLADENGYVDVWLSW